MHRNLAWLILLLIIFASTTVGCSSDAESESGRSGPVGGHGAFWECGGPRWDEALGQERYDQCFGKTGEWRCTCDSPQPIDVENPNLPTSSASSCDDALREVCEIEPEAVTPCGGVPDDGYIGKCFPMLDADNQVVDGAWMCRCGNDAEVSEVSSETCGDALESWCRRPCEVDGHHCDPTDTRNTYDCTCADGSSYRVGGELCEDAARRACEPKSRCSYNGDACEPSDGVNTWSCTCTSYYDATREVTGDDCQSAMRRACNPTAGRCNSWSGFCTEVHEPQFGYECECLDGTTEFRTPEELGNTDDCGLAVETVCGTTSPPPDWQCSKQTAGYEVVCTKSADQDEPEGYSCQCNYSCSGTGGAASGEHFETDSCADALSQMSCDNPC